jgi:hypothetical protein
LAAKKRCIEDAVGSAGAYSPPAGRHVAAPFRDPQVGLQGQIPSKSENRPGTPSQEILDPVLAPAPDPNSPLERALARFGAALGDKDRIEQGNGPASAT